MNRPNTKTLITVVVTLLCWALIGWMLVSLRNSTGHAQIETSTLLLRILCSGASLLLLLTCIALAYGLTQIAREAEAEQRFPPASAPQFRAMFSAEGEQAWLIAARLRGWAALAVTFGLVAAAAGLRMAFPMAPSHILPEQGLQPPIKSVPALVADQRSTLQAIPARSKIAPG